MKTMTNKEAPSVYVIKVSTQMGQNNYYAIDLKGSLSRNVQDSMLFCSEIVAESYAGTIEHILEEHMGAGLIPTTHVECVFDSAGRSPARKEHFHENNDNRKHRYYGAGAGQQ